MRILILCHAFNSLTQRVHAELAAAGHAVSVELDISDAVTREAVELFLPDTIVAPFLKRKIPEDVWKAVPCLIVHPGPPGDRGPNSLDWAMLEGAREWGVSIIRATGELDGGPVLASDRFPMRDARKSSLYRFEVTEAAVRALFEALHHLDAGEVPEDFSAHHPLPEHSSAATESSGWRGVVPVELRRVDWSRDATDKALRTIRAADGQPGARAELGGKEVRVFDARIATGLSGPAGTLLARRGGAVAVATSDGALWLGHLRAPEQNFKRAAVDVLNVEALPEHAPDLLDEHGPIRYTEHAAEGGTVGVLEFDFYNGAMGRRECAELLRAWEQVRRRGPRVVVLRGGSDFWSNGMDLNTIEAAESAADESWANINAIDDFAEALITATDTLVIAALGGNAAAGGVFLALAADHVWARDGVVLNPHYKNMGNLYGSEFWTYLLPRRVGEDGIQRVMGHRLPMLARQAETLGLIDAVGPNAVEDFDQWVLEHAGKLAGDSWEQAIETKRAQREADETAKPLHDWREQELERMKLNFYGFDPSYHVARYRLVQRTPHAWTPLHLARHRRQSKRSDP